MQAPAANDPGAETVRVASEIARMARDLAGESDRARRLPDPVVAALSESGLLRAGAPREVDALELPPATALRCAEQIAKGDASACWCVSIAITSSLLAAYLPGEEREELFGSGRGIAAGVWAPRGKGRRSTAASWSPVDGRSAAGSRTPT